MASQIESYSPFFQFFPSDWLSSKKMSRMTLEEQGAYMRLLCFTWDDKDCAIEDDDQALAEFSKLGEKWFDGSGDKIRTCFIQHPEKDGFLTHKRLLEERIKQQEMRKKNSKAGKISAKKRVEKLLGKEKNTETQSKQKAQEVERALKSCSRDVPTKAQQNSTFQFSVFGFQFSVFSFQGGEGKGDPESFLEFASDAHQRVLNSPLPRKSGKGQAAKDRKRVEDLLKIADLETLCVAWVLFLRSRDPHLVRKKKPRNIAVFGGQVDDYLTEAGKIVQQAKSAAAQAPPGKKFPVVPVTPADWLRLIAQIEEVVNPENFENWIEPLAFGGIDGNTLEIFCGDAIHFFNVTENFKELIEAKVAENFGPEIKPVFFVKT